MKYDDFLGRLEGVQGAAGGHVALCPAHGDRNPSLSLTAAHDRILLYCHAGCSADDVVTALGLDLKDLYYEDRFPGYSYIHAHQPEAIYDYTDEQGNLLYQVLRFPNKRFSQRGLVNGQWQFSMKGVRKVLYNLPGLLYDESGMYASPIYVVGGEKDADAINALRGPGTGFEATTNVGGEGKWLASYVKYFKDRDVVIVADADDVGLQHAQIVYGSLVHPNPYGYYNVARSAKIVQAKVGKDVSDHLAAGYTLNELEEVRL